VVLSACSTFFENILTRQNQSNLVLFLSGIRSEDLENIINFVYEGFVNVSMADVKTFVTAANVLGIKGITEVEMEDTAAVVKEKKTTKKKRRTKKSANIPLIINNDEEVEHLLEEPNQKSPEESLQLTDETAEEDKKSEEEATNTFNEAETENSKKEKLKEVQSKFSKVEILKAYRMMKQMKQNVKTEEVPETVTKENGEVLENTKVSNSRLFTVRRERKCELCEYTTTDSSNFKRHVSKRHSLN